MVILKTVLIRTLTRYVARTYLLSLGFHQQCPAVVASRLAVPPAPAELAVRTAAPEIDAPITPTVTLPRLSLDRCGRTSPFSRPVIVLAVVVVYKTDVAVIFSSSLTPSVTITTVFTATILVPDCARPNLHARAVQKALARLDLHPQAQAPRVLLLLSTPPSVANYTLLPL